MGKAVPVWRELTGWAGKPLGSTGGNYQGNIDSEKVYSLSRICWLWMVCADHLANNKRFCS